MADKTFVFSNIVIFGSGETEEEAWDNAITQFSIEPCELCDVESREHDDEDN
jgi:hypothetical protein